MSESSIKPEWFDRAIAAKRTDHQVTVEGCPIHYATWGEVGKPGLILIHGSNAHLEWWRFVAPFLADQFRVAAIDLSGNGDSGWRERYSGGIFAKEIMAVAADAKLGARPLVAGHSFGGFVALETGARYGNDLGGILFCDYTIPSKEQFVEWGLRAEENGPARPTRIYEDFDTALARFRLMPEQPCQHPYIIEYIGRQSLRQVEGGWTWKFDPAMYDYLEIGADQHERFLSIPCRSAFLLGEHSEDYEPGSVEHTRKLGGSRSPVYDLPGTYHHYMFDEPIAVVGAMKGILLTWLSQD